MPTQEISDILKTIDGSVSSFVDGLPDAQKTIYDRVLTLVKQFDTDAAGNIKNNISNIRILTQLQSAIHDVVMTDDYKKRIGDFTKTFDDIAKLQNKYLSTIFDKFSPTPVLAEITQASMDYTMDSLGDAGLSNDLANEIKDVLKQNILSGAKFSDMADQLRTSINGNDQIDGALVRYAKTYAIDSVNTFNASYNRQVTSDFNAVWYRYIGTNKETTRPFCEALTHKNNGYFHVSEIPGFLNGDVGTDSVPLYDKTGLPQGMKEGTNERTFFTNRGGWNCNHQIFPVSQLSVPKDLRDKFASDTKPETTVPKSQQPQPARQPQPAPVSIPVQQPIQPKPVQQPKQVQQRKQNVPETIGVTKQELLNKLVGDVTQLKNTSFKITKQNDDQSTVIVNDSGIQKTFYSAGSDDIIVGTDPSTSYKKPDKFSIEKFPTQNDVRDYLNKIIVDRNEKILLTQNPGKTLNELDKYKGSGYETLNQWLRTKQVPPTKNTTEEKLINSLNTLNEVISRNTIPDNLIMYRGFSIPVKIDDKNIDSLIGTTIKDDAFVSASFSENIAHDFWTMAWANNINNKNVTPIEMKILVPKGKNAIYMEGIDWDILKPGVDLNSDSFKLMQSHQEHEMLFPTKTEFEILGYEKKIDKNKKEYYQLLVKMK